MISASFILKDSIHSIITKLNETIMKYTKHDMMKLVYIETLNTIILGEKLILQFFYRLFNFKNHYTVNNIE